MIKGVPFWYPFLSIKNDTDKPVVYNVFIIPQ